MTAMDPTIDAILRTALALLFLVAAGHKLRDLGHFQATLVAYRLLPAGLIPAASILLVAVELGLAVMLAVPPLRTPGLLTAAAVLTVYGAAVGINLVRGRRDLDCGCAGPAVRRPITGWLVVRNGVLAAAALAGLAPVGGRGLGWIDVVTVVGAVVTLAAVHASLDRMLAQAPALARLRGAT